MEKSIGEGQYIIAKTITSRFLTEYPDEFTAAAV